MLEVSPPTPFSPTFSMKLGKKKFELINRSCRQFTNLKNFISMILPFELASLQSDQLFRGLSISRASPSLGIFVKK